VTEVGMRPFDHHLPASVGEAELRSLVQKLNADPAVHGILVQMPLPPECAEFSVLTKWQWYVLSASTVLRDRPLFRSSIISIRKLQRSFAHQRAV
jgi:hypothetical protein